ncbi:ABC transporter ATP-binding protein, partial [Nitratireductor sp. ZSWI3]|uniref:ATP-binding cassette domain-containing protein n=1 Tax=Nitratireductor sp. ZSWI3 TaxID=2966359 RepID=UPI002150284C
MRLAIASLSVTLAGRRILSDVSLDLAPGTVVGLLGPNGAGKSTLMRALAGQVAAGGTIRLGTADIAALGPADRARLIAYLPQARAIGWRLRVRDLVA